MAEEKSPSTGRPRDSIPTTPPESPRISRVRWKTADYDDETLLLQIGLSNPTQGWIEIAQLFNLKVPQQRVRTVDAITSKCNGLLRGRGLIRSPITPGFVPWGNADLQNPRTQVQRPRSPPHREY